MAMRRLMVIVAVCVLGYLAWGQVPTTPPGRDVSAAQAKALLDRGAVLIDVREVSEWEQGHLVPQDRLFPQDRWGQIAEALKGREAEPIVVYCRSGRRSGLVVKMLREKGFSQSVSVAGGYSALSKELPPGETGK